MIKRLIQRIMDEKIKGILRHILTFAGGYYGVLSQRKTRINNACNG
jgi:hypothetical protein